MVAAAKTGAPSPAGPPHHPPGVTVVKAADGQATHGETDAKTARDAGYSPPAPKSGKRGIIFLLVLLIGGVGGGGYWWSRRGLETTDDAQVDAEVVAVPSRASGTLVKVLFVENQAVKENDLLALVDDAPARARARAAAARVVAAEDAADAADAEARVAAINARGKKAVSSAQLTTASMGALSATDQIKEAETAQRSADVALKQAETDEARDKSLFDSGAITKAVLDQSETALDLARSNADGVKARLATLNLSRAQAQSRVVEASAEADESSDTASIVAQAEARARAARADVDTAKAALDLANLDVAYTEIRAPADGILSKKAVNEGQAIAVGQPIGELVTNKVWVGANFKETQIQKMRVGQKVQIEVDSFPGVVVLGEVESFAGATGSKFTLLPPDNASGNFTKVVQRLPVRVKFGDLPQGVALRPGMSVEITVNTR